jgi:hypothetical protein
VIVVVNVVLLLAETNALLFASEGLSSRMVFTVAIWLLLQLSVLSESRALDPFVSHPAPVGRAARLYGCSMGCLARRTVPCPLKCA